MSWIKLVIHRRHDKVLLIADLTGATPISALAAAIEWFRWVDEHVDHDADTSISLSGFREVTAWPDDGLSRAMCHADVDWLEKGSDGRLRPTRTDSHFGASEKARAQNAKRQERYRKRNGGVTQSVTQNALEEKRREEKTTPPTPRGREEPDGGGDGGGKSVVLTPEQADLYRLIVARPAWLPQDRDWVDQLTARDLAVLPSTTAKVIEFYMRLVRGKRKLDNPAGVFVKAMRHPDAGVVASFQTHQVTVSDIHDMASNRTGAKA